MRIAVVGSGAAGLGAAWALSQRHDVTLFEAGAHLGGHAHTVDVDIGAGRVPVDTGFIVYNEFNYPALTRLFAHLGVATEPSNMSFSVSIDGGGREYEASAKGLFLQLSNVVSIKHWRMIREVTAFYGQAERLIEDPLLANLPLGEFLDACGFSKTLARDNLLPLAGAIWSSTSAQTLAFPAATFIRFFSNHGLLGFRAGHEWRTVSGGSRNYVSKVVQDFRGEIRLKTAVVEVSRLASGVVVRDSTGASAQFDQVVLATHADQALGILEAGATMREHEILGAVKCQDNKAYLHSDARLMPRRRRIWSSWNTLTAGEASGERPVFVSYWMNRLQNLETRAPLIVSLNPFTAPDPEKVHLTYRCRHPQFDRSALAAQAQLCDVQGVDRVWFCGAWTGYGFHEDALASGLAVAEALGSPAPFANEIAHRSPAAENARPLGCRLAAE